MWQPRVPLRAHYRGAVAPATRSRRPLPRRVYWFRRLLVLGVAAVLVLGVVFGTARLLDWTTGGSAGSAGPGAEQAAPVAASPGEPSGDARGTDGPRKQKPGTKQQRAEKDQLAKPNGPCLDSDVVVTPTITDAHAGSRVLIVLELTTVKAAACHWEVSSDSVFVNIDGEDGTLWSSQHCPDAVPTKSVVPRRGKAATVRMWWDGKLSDEGCPVWSAWVEDLGSYTVVAAARGSVTPVATGFFLGSAVAPTVTTTATPTPTPSPTSIDRPSTRPSTRPSDEPSDEPTGKPSE